MTSRQSAAKHKISGRVISGAGYGRKIGFPTANIDRKQFARSGLLKKTRFGIYAGHVWLDSKKYKAGIVVGPIDKSGLPRLEAHLIGYKGNLYGKKLAMDLIKYVRPFKVYKSEKQLVAAIKKDFSAINRFLKKRIQPV